MVLQDKIRWNPVQQTTLQQGLFYWPKETHHNYLYSVKQDMKAASVWD